MAWKIIPDVSVIHFYICYIVYFGLQSTVTNKCNKILHAMVIVLNTLPIVTPPPPSDAAYLYTSNFFAGSLYWSFDTFNETGDGSYPNQNVNMSMYNAIPGLAVQQNYSISGNSIWTRFNGTDDCIDFGDFSGSCFSDPSLCTDGFALAFWIRLTEDEIRESGPVYIMSSGKIHWVCPRLLKSYLPYFPQTFV